MGIILDNSNSYLNTILDILIVFVLGTILLFFANAIKNEGKFLTLYVSIIVIGIILFNAIYLHNRLPTKEKESNAYNMLTFFNIYVMVLMVFVSLMSIFIQTNNS